MVLDIIFSNGEGSEKKGMKSEYVSLVLSLLAALAWIPSLIQTLKRPKYVLTARLKDTFKLRRFKRFMDGKERFGFVLIIAVDFCLEEPQGGAFLVNEVSAKIKFKGDKKSYDTLYLNQLEYNQVTGVPEPVRMQVVFSDRTNILESSNISWNQKNKKIIPLFIPADTEKYSGKYDTVEWIKITLSSGAKRKCVVNVKLGKDFQEKGFIKKYIKPVSEVKG